MLFEIFGQRQNSTIRSFNFSEKSNRNIVLSTKVKGMSLKIILHFRINSIIICTIFFQT
jgi:hypothetical protein